MKEHIFATLFIDLVSTFCWDNNWGHYEHLRNIRFRRDFNEKNKKLLRVEKELNKSKEKFLTEEEKIFNLLD